MKEDIISIKGTHKVPRNAEKKRERDLLKHPLSKEEMIDAEEIKRGRGITKAIPLENFLWNMEGLNKLDRLVEVASIYVSEPSVFNFHQLFFPVPNTSASGNEQLLECSSISHFLSEWYRLDLEQLYWTDKYKDLMFTPNQSD